MQRILVFTTRSNEPRSNLPETVIFSIIGHELWVPMRLIMNHRHGQQWVELILRSNLIERRRVSLRLRNWNTWTRQRHRSNEHGYRSNQRVSSRQKSAQGGWHIRFERANICVTISCDSYKCAGTDPPSRLSNAAMLMLKRLRNRPILDNDLHLHGVRMLCRASFVVIVATATIMNRADHEARAVGLLSFRVDAPSMALGTHACMQPEPQEILDEPEPDKPPCPKSRK